jgi:hypothetical protein
MNDYPIEDRTRTQEPGRQGNLTVLIDTDTRSGPVEVAVEGTERNGPGLPRFLGFVGQITEFATDMAQNLNFFRSNASIYT